MSRRRPPRPLSAEEREAWRRVARTVNPLEPGRLKPLDDPTPPAADAGSHPRSAPDKAGAAGLPKAWFEGASAPPARHPVDRGAERRVRRGRVEVEARIDLHGWTQVKARAELLAFLRRSHARGLKTVLVITGKGAAKRAVDERRYQPWRPDEPSLPGVIRRSFTRWLVEPDFAGLVSGYATAHRRHGGDGAFYVVLRRN